MGGPNVKVVATIAGSDSGGGAGIQADLRAITANGGFGASIVTAITAQNTVAVTMSQEMAPAMIDAQFDAVFGDMRVSAVKTGMLAGGQVIETVAAALRRHRPPFFVLDPVMVSKSGYRLLEEEAIAALRETLFPLATVITPNVHEAEALTGRTVRSVADAEDVGREVLSYGPGAVLVKGGHLISEPATDVLVTEGGSTILPGEWIDTKHTHGTGCTYSAAIATHLARGRSLADAARLSKAYVTEAIRGGLAIGEGNGPTDHLFYARRPDLHEWAERLGLARSWAE